MKTRLPGIIVAIVIFVGLQMILPFPLGLYSVWVFVIIFGIIFAVIAYYKTKDGDKSPNAILKERYAKGEITKEEFDKMKEDLS